MRSFIYILLAFQLSLWSVVAQITFTREWVNGKRSSPNNIFSLQSSQEYPPCKSLWPAIEILMETEKLQQAHCGIHLKPSKFLAHFKDTLAKSGSKQQEDDSLQFDEDPSSSKNP
ncbi:unnamed protein product [Allacma fusca]|uniref:Adipokinetic hormone n=1 Tax=Allacma fusca TaxID=39272 RepID=A0A8J2JEE8_9HEXA|nr:unnamed protein product [Allacma fusca]